MLLVHSRCLSPRLFSCRNLYGPRLRNGRNCVLLRAEQPRAKARSALPALPALLAPGRSCGPGPGLLFVIRSVRAQNHRGQAAPGPRPRHAMPDSHRRAPVARRNEHNLPLSLPSSSPSPWKYQLRLRPCAKPSGRPTLQVTDTIDSFLGREVGGSSFGGLATGFAASRSAAAKGVGKQAPPPPFLRRPGTAASQWQRGGEPELSELCPFRGGGICRVWRCSTGP